MRRGARRFPIGPSPDLPTASSPCRVRAPRKSSPRSKPTRSARRRGWLTRLQTYCGRFRSTSRGVNFICRQHCWRNAASIYTTFRSGSHRPVSEPRLANCALSRGASSSAFVSKWRNFLRLPSRRCCRSPSSGPCSIALRKVRRISRPKFRRGGGNGSSGAPRATQKELRGEIDQSAVAQFRYSAASGTGAPLHCARSARARSASAFFLSPRRVPGGSGGNNPKLTFIG